jgi:hypothetical protein
MGSGLEGLRLVIDTHHILNYFLYARIVFSCSFFLRFIFIKFTVFLYEWNFQGFVMFSSIFGVVTDVVITIHKNHNQNTFFLFEDCYCQILGVD